MLHKCCLPDAFDPFYFSPFFPVLKLSFTQREMYDIANNSWFLFRTISNREDIIKFGESVKCSRLVMDQYNQLIRVLSKSKNNTNQRWKHSYCTMIVYIYYIVEIFTSWFHTFKILKKDRNVMNYVQCAIDEEIAV